MLKKIISLSLICILTLPLGGCLDSKSDGNDTDNKPSTSEENKNDNGNKNYIEDNSNESPSKNKVERKTVRLYYFHMENMEMIYIDKEIEIIDGALTKALTKAYQNEKNDKLVPINPKVEVTKAKVENGILKIYFNDDFTKNVNLGTATESGLVNGLVSTYGYNFKVDKVALYCNDMLYTGLKGELPEGYYKVDLQGKKLN